MELTLSETECELLEAELAAALEQTTQPAAREAYGAALAAVRAGRLGEAELPAVTALLEVGLESGRIRRRHTAHGEMAARGLWARTPAGRAVQESAAAASAALQALVGQPLAELSITPAGPGAYLLALGTDQGRVMVRLDRLGVRAQSVEVG